MKIKHGVRIAREWAIPVALLASAKAYADAGKPMTLTSGIEGRHSRGSKHYCGHAIDLRTRHLDDPIAVTNQIKAALGADYDVVLESDHLHIEYDPKDALEKQ